MYKVTWKPSPNKWNGRATHLPIAIVNHRMVGYLPGTERLFANPDANVSAHFGIGYRGGYGVGPVEITQFVDLRDSAWCNGNYDPSGGWPLVKKNPDGSVINPNYYTISIEHEDGASAHRGIVTPEVRAASEWLTRILLTGNLEVYALAGIRCSSQPVADSLRTLNLYEETYIDHNRIAGTRKPYCWRKWLDDGGFVPAYRPTMMANAKDKSMLVADILELLKQEYDKVVDERDAAIIAASEAAAAAEAAEAEAAAVTDRLTRAKALAAQIVAI